MAAGGETGGGAFEAKRENGRGWCETHDGYDAMVVCFSISITGVGGGSGSMLKFKE